MRIQLTAPSTSKKWWQEPLIPWHGVARVMKTYPTDDAADQGSRPAAATTAGKTTPPPGGGWKTESAPPARAALAAFRAPRRSLLTRRWRPWQEPIRKYGCWGAARY